MITSNITADAAVVWLGFQNVIAMAFQAVVYTTRFASEKIHKGAEMLPNLLGDKWSVFHFFQSWRAI